MQGIKGGVQGIKTSFRIDYVQAGCLADHSKNPGDQNAEQDRAFHLFNIHDRGDEQSQHCQDRADAFLVQMFSEADHSQKGGGISGHQMRALKADKRDKQADTSADRMFQVNGNRIKNRFTHICQGQHNENNTFNKYCQQRDSPVISHLSAHCKRKVCVQAHAGRQSKRIICHQCHQQSAEERGQCSCHQNCVCVHSSCAQQAGVDCQYVRHGHERCQAGDHFCFDSRVVLFELKELF